MTIKYNKYGGITDDDPLVSHRAKEADLITFPPDIKGTNCYNCKFIKKMKPSISYCKHPKVLQYVNSHMCCIFWTDDKELRNYKGRSKKLD